MSDETQATIRQFDRLTRERDRAISQRDELARAVAEVRAALAQYGSPPTDALGRFRGDVLAVRLTELLDAAPVVAERNGEVTT